MAFSREFRDRLKIHDIGFGEFVHLERLWTEDGLNQTELSRRVGIENASSTAVLDTLENRRYIRRERDPRDRRNIRVFLTPLGRKLQRKLLGCAEATNLIARKGMRKKDVLKFFSLMEVIASNLERTGHFQSRQKRGRERFAGGSSSYR
jgi:MarR family transcriptional regulator, organic hydroperoxide resistance regulator